MDRQEKHHQHHQKEREQENKHKKEIEKKPGLHPVVLYVVGTVLVLLIVLGWIMYF